MYGHGTCTWPAESNPIQSNPIQSNPIQSNPNLPSNKWAMVPFHPAFRIRVVQ
jgi:hypothetical protein